MGPVQLVSPRRSVLRRRFGRSRVPLHRRLRQDPAAVRHWVLVAIVAALLASVVGQALSRADHARRRWGQTSTVWVVERPLRAGDALDGAVRAERWPAALVPTAAVHPPPRSARAAGPVDAGAVLTAAMIEARTSARRTVAVTVPDGHLPVQAGDRVDVWATTDPATAADGTAATRRVAADARVGSASGRSVVLEVQPGQVEALAEAAATATLTLVGDP